MRICFRSAPTSTQQPKPGYQKSTLNDKTQFKHVFFESKRGCQATSSRVAWCPALARRRLARHPPVKTFTSHVQGHVSHTTTNLRIFQFFNSRRFQKRNELKKEKKRKENLQQVPCKKEKRKRREREQTRGSQKSFSQHSDISKPRH